MSSRRIQPFNLGRHQWARGSGRTAPYPQAMDVLVRSDTARPRESFEVSPYLVAVDLLTKYWL